MKGFNTNSAKEKSNFIIVGSGTEKTDMNEMLTAKKDLYKTKISVGNYYFKSCLYQRKKIHP